MHGSNNNFLFFYFLFTYNTKYKKKRHWLFLLTNSITLAQLLLLHACITVQQPRVCCSCKCLALVWVVLKEWNHVEIFQGLESPFLIYLDSLPASYTYCAIIAWGKTTLSTIKVLKLMQKIEGWRLKL